MSNGKDGTERSVSDVLAAIRARVQAEEAGLSATPQADGPPPMRLGLEQQVEDAQTVRGLRRETVAVQPPLRLDSPAEVPTLRLSAPIAPETLRLDQPVAQPQDITLDTDDAQPDADQSVVTDEIADDVPEAPHVQIDDLDEDRSATITKLFAAAMTRPTPQTPAEMTADQAARDLSAGGDFGEHIDAEDEGVLVDDEVVEDDAAHSDEPLVDDATPEEVEEQADAIEADPVALTADITDELSGTESAEIRVSDALDGTESPPAPDQDDSPLHDEAIPNPTPEILAGAGDLGDEQHDDTPDPIQESEGEQVSPSDGYDIWAADPDVAVQSATTQDLTAPDAEPKPTSSGPVASPAPFDPTVVREIVQQVLSEQIESGDDDVRAEIRAIVAEEIRGVLGDELAKSIRKSLRKDILRAFKDRGLN